MKLLEKLQVSNEHEVKLALPNELFYILTSQVEKGNIKSSHLPFAYSYVYFITYMYRYGKYEQFMASQSDIKEVLGYARNYKPINYIIKEDGVLEKLGLLETTKCIPITYNWNGIYDDNLNYVEIKYFHQSKDDLDDAYQFQKNALGITSRTTIKRPRFAYIRDLSVDLDVIDCVDDYTGTFYSTKNTHIIDFRIFDFCINQHDLGVIGFYIYSYLKHKNYIFGGYDASAARLSKELGLSAKTIQNYRDALRKYNLINLVHNNDSFCSWKKHQLKAPTNYVNEFEKIVTEGVEYEKFLDSIIRKGVEKEATSTIKSKNVATNETIYIPENLLPF